MCSVRVKDRIANRTVESSGIRIGSSAPRACLSNAQRGATPTINVQATSGTREKLEERVETTDVSRFTPASRMASRRRLVSVSLARLSERSVRGTATLTMYTDLPETCRVYSVADRAAVARSPAGASLESGAPSPVPTSHVRTVNVSDSQTERRKNGVRDRWSPSSSPRRSWQSLIMIADRI